MPRRKPAPPSEVAHPEGPASGHVLWSGTLSFGLVAIPVQLYSAQRSLRASLRTLSSDGVPLGRRYFAPGSTDPLEPEEIVRGYELERDQYIPLSDQELDSLAPEQSRDIELTRFVPSDAISPLYFEHSYFLIPSSSNVAYRLLVATMARTNRAGIATFVMHGKQQLVAILAEDGLMRAEVLRFQDELRPPIAVATGKARRVLERDRTRIQRAVKRLIKPGLARRELTDHYWGRLSALAEQKRAKRHDVVHGEPHGVTAHSGSNVIDLMEALKKSLGTSPRSTPATRRSQPRARSRDKS